MSNDGRKCPVLGLYAPFYKYKNGVASPMTLNMVEQHARNVGRIYTPAMTKLGSA